MTTIKRFFIDSFYLDQRSLLASRIILAIATLACLWQVSIDFDMLIGKNSYFPARSTDTVPYFARLYFISYDSNYQTLLLLLTAILALLQISGPFSRISSLLLFPLIISLQSWLRPMTNSGFPMLATWFLISSLILHNKDRESQASYKFYCIGGTLLFFQIAFTFLNSVMFKYHNESWLNGLATYYALEIDPHSSFLGQQLRRLPSWIFKFATYTTLFIETFIPFLLLLGSKNQKARLVALLIFTALVLGFLLFLEIGTFPIVFLAGLVAAYPSCFWNSFKIKTFKIDLAPIRIVSTRPNSIMVFILGSLLLLSHFNSISSNTIKIPEFLNTNFYQPLGLKQNWGVFCQDTWKSYSIVLEAKTKEGYPSDLWKWWSDGNEGDPSWIFPPSPYYVRNNFRSSLWRDLLFYVAPINDNQEIPNLTKALCNKYNSEMSEKIVSVKALRAQREVIGYHKYWFSPGEKIFEIRCGTDPR